ncbi:S-adenosyl-L-methionine-dependent methyltransferase [Dacryopinax primogenitus]|uniref:S-adenosyl-L-methionine-dependent methyltransferase n=1 Tax=Dacryopinax primogenitus (strain DJM 731) TaxID=1858805 RepID=M5FTD0_DACPD|nr:S-adenosyl-L-methionine-dependent methyltransferase [Dacryopinax primogenitus]EJT99303.1 S-adenosyl-L-methionine-dependent methyltransferase [Dacryopinax primogenitus]
MGNANTKLEPEKPSAPPDPLIVLVSSLNDAVDALQKVLQVRQLPAFELDSPIPHPLDSGLPDPVSWFARKAIVGLCSKIIATVESPAERALVLSNAWLIPVALNVVIESEPPVVDLIAETGEIGATVTSLAGKTGIDAAKLRSILRVLTSESFFKEITPGRYVLNRPSSVLVTGNAIGDLVSFTSGPSMRGGSVLSKALRHDGLPAGDKYEETVFKQTAFQLYHQKALYPWLMENPRYLTRFHRGMTQLELYMDPGISCDYPWEELGESVTLVDVGSGRGGLTMTLLKRFPKWKAVLQDRAEALSAIREFWEKEATDIVDADRVSFLAQDFFQVTSLRATDDSHYVFMIKNVLHNWGDEHCLKILRNLGPAAAPGSTLLVCTYMPAIPQPDEKHITVKEYFDGISGKDMREIQEMHLPIPEPLWADWGYGNAYETRSGAAMTGLLNAAGRDIYDLRNLLSAASWEVASSTQMRSAASMIKAIKLQPAPLPN